MRRHMERNRLMKRFRMTGLILIAGVVVTAPAILGAEPPRITLSNGQISAEFRAGSLVHLSSLVSKQFLELDGDSASLTVGGETLAVPDLRLLDTQQGKESLAFTFRAGDKTLQVVYNLQQGWHFVSKQLVLTIPGGSTTRVDAVEVFRADLKTPVLHEYRAGRGSGTVFLRLGGSAPPKSGMFLAIQNPFLKWERKGQQVSVAYAPGMEWRADYGPFASDPVCIGLYTLSGNEYPARAVEEWRYIRDPEKAFEGRPALDWAEIDALTRCVEAFVLYRPTTSLKIHVPWCENDYQIDVGTPTGRMEYKRIIDQVAAVG
jgi:hypothetical protein